MESKKNLVIDIILVFAVYYLVLAFAMIIAKSVFGSEIDKYMLCQVFATIITIPIMFFFFGKHVIPIGRHKFVWQDLLLTLLIAATLATSVNNILCMTPLVEMSKGFEEANEAFYSSSLVIEIIGSAILTPILEELVFRGIIYRKIRIVCNAQITIIISAVIFSVIHFNIVQCIYALVLGVALGIIVEKTGHLYFSILAHFVANLLAVLRTEIGLLEWSVDGSLLSWIFAIVLFLCGFGVLDLLIYRHNSDTIQ